MATKNGVFGIGAALQGEWQAGDRAAEGDGASPLGKRALRLARRRLKRRKN